MLHKDQKGVAHLLGVVVLLVLIAVIGGAGYMVMQKNKKTESATGPTPPSSDEKSELSWTKGDFAVKGAYADADIVKVFDTKHRLYFASQPEGGKLEVYSATSTDGKTWTMEEGTRKKMATFPDVVKLKDNRYRMYFQNAGVIKSAVSSDGLTFTDEAGTRVDTSNDEGLTFDNVAAPTVIENKDGTYLMVYRGTINTRYAANTPNPTTQLLMWATSSDGLNFTKKGIAVDSRNDTLAGQLDGPDLVYLEDNVIAVYATSYTGVYEFAFDQKEFSEPVLAFAGEAKKDSKGMYVGAPPGDPTLAKIDGVWYMYYGNTGAESGIHYATLK
jgi:hypothetical protein